MSAPPIILALVARFAEQLDAYKAGHYNETQLRREFLDPFFTALGWDVDNAQGYAEAYKDVIHEESIRIGGATKAPDYGFRIGGTRKFFVEAKKPSVDIQDEPGAAYQLRRYAWSAKLPLSILSNFDEFAVYDGRVKPHQNDPAATARIFHCTFREVAEKWLLRPVRRIQQGQTRHLGSGCLLPGGNRELARRTRPQPRPPQPQAHPARTQLRRPAHH
jgi:hypothetical protein